MKKGFTMIELVFVIVILGILASLAVPKLAATKDDAEAAKAAVEIKDAITQLTTYYIVNGSYPKDNINGKDVTTLNADTVKPYSPTIAEVLGRTNPWTDCIKITPSNGSEDGTTPANIKVAKKDAGKSSFCQAVRGTQAYKDWSKLAESNGIQVGGSGIFKEGTTTN
ncbi:type II secretion system protein [Campylobacter hyointestinalis]|uniref:type II secretion system protein n=1 Tax=Campylobacter hyointestinalis TaxID=198 RepID=UPI000CE4FFAC|nr:prepilin-type N-terminal cleavage/methylation domain-containing protein [Campylobacter hyointestinalis]PPB74221.1 hypothetical protein CDQ79_00300 [Campylobacter hyointestinalis subsp. hyointestinalis]PPB75139.1 hypothetical protein CDQ80_03795 [Campylobacter hyointestinalis subsp. hyointestinalis]PPB77462.1 hypothetical protein CDQ81_02090 [Campylobacter hyointestinalis subsp. hyointestinalis]PPB78554.1 hypothetical protein CDQ82_03815 [Campylobacter hyointestinalis subsp. hyointestinalis]